MPDATPEREGREPADDEIRGVVGNLPPQAAAKALAAHLQVDIQVAHDLLDGFYWRKMWEGLGKPLPTEPRP